MVNLDKNNVRYHALIREVTACPLLRLLNGAGQRTRRMMSYAKDAFGEAYKKVGELSV